MSFLILKGLHVSCVATSYTLFVTRGIWRLRNSLIIQQRWVRIVPHVVDTLLLTSAIALAFSIKQFPFVDAWLTAKVLGLLLYIGLGFIALKHGSNKATRILAWLAAQAIFAYIVLVAIYHNPMPFTH